jgi:hypothetical protein
VATTLHEKPFMQALLAGLLLFALGSTASTITPSQGGVSSDESRGSPQSNDPLQLVSSEVVVVGHDPEAPDVPQRNNNPPFLIPIVVLIPYAIVAPTGACITTEFQGAPLQSTESAIGRFPSFPADRSMSIGALYPSPAARSKAVAVACQPSAPHSRSQSHQ